MFANTPLTEPQSDARDALLDGSKSIQQVRQSLDMMPAGFRARCVVIPVSESRRLVAALAPLLQGAWRVSRHVYQIIRVAQ